MKENIMWSLIGLTSLIVSYLAIIFLRNEVDKLSILSKLTNDPKKKRAVSLIIVLVFCVLCGLILSLSNAIMIIVHLTFFTLVIKLLIRIINKKYLNYTIVISLIITSLYMGKSYINYRDVRQVEYTLKTDKLNENLKVVMFSDSHISKSFSVKDLDKYIEDINNLNPDVVCIVGDLIDDGTTLEEIKDTSKSLGNLKAKYGVYYVFGNHDKGYYNFLDGKRTKELISSLKENNVIILEDETILIRDDFYIVGRADKSNKDRKDIANLIEDLDENKYQLVLDHQPNDYKNEADTKVDLVLSGHTHGGQMYPIGKFAELVGINDFTYGHTKIDDTDFIVSSGISDWEIQFKSFCGSEYLIINIENN